MDMYHVMRRRAIVNPPSLLDTSMQQPAGSPSILAEDSRFANIPDNQIGLETDDATQVPDEGQTTQSQSTQEGLDTQLSTQEGLSHKRGLAN